MTHHIKKQQKVKLDNLNKATGGAFAKYEYNKKDGSIGGLKQGSPGGFGLEKGKIKEGYEGFVDGSSIIVTKK